MKKQLNPIFCLTVLGSITLLGAGCTTVVRENIISSIDTGIGASVMENKQTQLYELKAGYIHSQFYSIPTGKVVENQKYHKTYGSNGVVKVIGDHQTNRADITPQLVAGIRAKTSLADVILGMEVSESFAVGSDAVKSDAATAMYIANAKDSKSADAAANAVRTLPPGVMSVQTEKDSVSAYKQYKGAATAEVSKWDAVIAATTDKTDMKDLVKNGLPEDWDAAVRALKNKKLMK